MRPRHHCRPTMPARARTRDRSMAPPGGAGGLRARILDGLHRWFRADGRAAETARLFRRRSCLRAMGAQRLHPGAGRADVDRRRACRSLRQGAHAGCGLYRLRPVIGGLRGSALDRVADRVPRGAGDFGGDPDAIESGAHRRDLSQGRTQPRHRRVGRRFRAYHRRRTGARRLADRKLRLAMGVCDQPAAGADRSGAAVWLCAARSACGAAFRCRGRRDPGGRAGRAGLGLESNRSG